MSFRTVLSLFVLGVLVNAETLRRESRVLADDMDSRLDSDSKIDLDSDKTELDSTSDSEKPDLDSNSATTDDKVGTGNKASITDKGNSTFLSTLSKEDDSSTTSSSVGTGLFDSLGNESTEEYDSKFKERIHSIQNEIDDRDRHIKQFLTRGLDGVTSSGELKPPPLMGQTQASWVKLPGSDGPVQEALPVEYEPKLPSEIAQEKVAQEKKEKAAHSAQSTLQKNSKKLKSRSHHRGPVSSHDVDGVATQARGAGVDDGHVEHSHNGEHDYGDDNYHPAPGQEQQQQDHPHGQNDVHSLDDRHSLDHHNEKTKRALDDLHPREHEKMKRALDDLHPREHEIMKWARDDDHAHEFNHGRGPWRSVSHTEEHGSGVGDVRDTSSDHVDHSSAGEHESGGVDGHHHDTEEHESGGADGHHNDPEDRPSAEEPAARPQARAEEESERTAAGIDRSDNTANQKETVEVDAYGKVSKGDKSPQMVGFADSDGHHMSFNDEPQ